MAAKNINAKEEFKTKAIMVEQMSIKGALTDILIDI